MAFDLLRGRMRSDIDGLVEEVVLLETVLMLNLPRDAVFETLTTRQAAKISTLEGRLDRLTPDQAQEEPGPPSLTAGMADGAPMYTDATNPFAMPQSLPAPQPPPPATREINIFEELGHVLEAQPGPIRQEEPASNMVAELPGQC